MRVETKREGKRCIVRLRLIVLLMLSAFLIAGCGGEREALRVDRLEGHVVVEMVGLRFVPYEIEITPGTQVVFVNMDRQVHNVVTGSLDDQQAPREQSPLMASADEWSFVFNEVGTYEMMCTVAGHNLAGMVGRVIVTETPSSTN